MNQICSGQGTPWQFSAIIEGDEVFDSDDEHISKVDFGLIDSIQLIYLKLKSPLEGEECIQVSEDYNERTQNVEKMNVKNTHPFHWLITYIGPINQIHY